MPLRLRVCRAEAAHGLCVFQHGPLQPFEYRIGLVYALRRKKVALHRIPAVHAPGLKLPHCAEQAVFRPQGADPFCGSGTFPIEAAMMAAGIAPGMNRSFLAEDWKHLVPRRHWYDAVEEAEENVNLNIETDIQGYDIDPEAIKAARANARSAGVDRLIHFQQRAVKDLRHPKPYGFVITNPPYGERLEEKAELPRLYQEIGESFRHLDKWSMYLITSYENAERDIGRKADKNRKIYNGMLKTYYYQFLGPKPPRREHQV